jgi:hypothetical protein
MGSERTHVRLVVNVDKPTRVIGLVQMDMEKQTQAALWRLAGKYLRRMWASYRNSPFPR